MKILQDLLEKQLQHLYIAESLILEELPGMLYYVSEENLLTLIQAHIQMTFNQKIRLEKIADYLRIKIDVKDGQMIKGLIDETHKLYDEFPRGMLLDIGIVSKLQLIQHFQIAGYEIVSLYLKSMKLTEVLPIIETTLDEAYSSDEDCSSYVKKSLSRRDK